MTYEEKIDRIIDVLTAQRLFKPIQIRNANEEWRPLSGLVGVANLCDNPENYRVKKEPVVRPWSKPDDVPGPVCWIRGVYPDGRPDYRQHLIVGFSGEVAYQTISGGCEPIACSSLFSETRWDRMEYSTDRKTWRPCTVEETE